MHRPQQPAAARATASLAVSFKILYGAILAVVKAALPVAKAASGALLLSVAIPLVILAGMCSAATDQLGHWFPHLASQLSRALGHVRQAVVTKVATTLSAPAVLRTLSAGFRHVLAAVQLSFEAVRKRARVILISAAAVIVATAVLLAAHNLVIAVFELSLGLLPADVQDTARWVLTCDTLTCLLTGPTSFGASAVGYIVAVGYIAAVRYAAAMGFVAIVGRAEYKAAVSLQAFILRVVAIVSLGTFLPMIAVVTACVQVTLQLFLAAVIALLKRLEAFLEEGLAAPQGAAGTAPQGSTGTASADTGSDGTAPQGTARPRPSPIYSYYGHRPSRPKEQPRHQHREQSAPSRSRDQPHVPDAASDTYSRDQRDQTMPQAATYRQPVASPWHDVPAARTPPTASSVKLGSAAKATTGPRFCPAGPLLDDWQPQQQRLGKPMHFSSVWPAADLPEQASVLLKHSRTAVRAAMLCQLDLALLDVSQAAVSRLRATGSQPIPVLTDALSVFRSSHAGLKKTCSKNTSTADDAYQQVTKQLEDYSAAKEQLQQALCSIMPEAELAKAVQNTYSARAQQLDLPRFTPTWTPDSTHL